MTPIAHNISYNAETRYLEQKIIIYFSGIEPLEITRDNFLIDSSILEEAYSPGDSTPFGNVTSNELSFSLFNEHGLFNPENTASKYYGLIRKGIKVASFIKPVESYEWDSLGVFYVTDWTTNSNNMTVDVTANDILYNVINGDVPNFSVFRNISFKDFIIKYFSYFGCSVIIDDTINIILPYVYMSAYSDNKSFLTALMCSVLADCFCNHKGEITILSKISQRDVKDTFTDNDQIISISIKQSLVTNYDSAVVTCNKGQEGAEQNLLSINNINLVPGLNSLGKFKTSMSPILCVKHVKSVCKDNIKINSFNASDSEISCILQSTSNTVTSLDITGTTLEIIVSTIGTAGEAPLKVDSKFIQQENVANQIKDYAEAYVNVNTPTLELSVRGNPQLEIGDMVEINSTHYKVKYSGTIIKANYEYQGHLSCSLTLANASLIKKEV